MRLEDGIIPEYRCFVQYRTVIIAITGLKILPANFVFSSSTVLHLPLSRSSSLSGYLLDSDIVDKTECRCSYERDIGISLLWVCKGQGMLKVHWYFISGGYRRWLQPCLSCFRSTGLLQTSSPAMQLHPTFNVKLLNMSSPFLIIVTSCYITV